MNSFIKRLFDIVSSGILLVLISPLLIIISIGIIIDSKGPILFKQERRTKNGRIFIIYKFRSMIVNAEKVGTGLFNYENDYRITKIGRILRSTSLDELPQLINILKGDMSVVGPRPCVTFELGDYETLNTKFKKRFQVKAGLTGWAQVKGRNNISWLNKVSYDNEYVDLLARRGIFIDIHILVLSLIKVFKKENLYENKINENISDEESAIIQEREIIRIAHLTDEELEIYENNSRNNTIESRII
mgnify:CR=1 FL=1